MLIVNVNEPNISMKGRDYWNGFFKNQDAIICHLYKMYFINMQTVWKYKYGKDIHAALT